MGKLRLEAKTRTMDSKKYKNTLRILVEARKAAGDNKIFWDLEATEQPGIVRKEFLYVARKEGLPIKIRQLRKQRSLAIEFPSPEKERSRMSKDEYKKRVIQTLTRAGRPLKKSEVVAEAGVSAASWNLRIQELLQGGQIERTGTRSETVYSLPNASPKGKAKAKTAAKSKAK